MKGIIGIPGSNESPTIRKAESINALGYPPNWLKTALSVEPVVPLFVTNKPAAVETMRAGI